MEINFNQGSTAVKVFSKPLVAILVIFLSLVVFSVTGAASAGHDFSSYNSLSGDVIVDDDGSEDANTIAAGITDAGSGEVVLVKEGSYDSFKVDKDVTVVAENSPSSTNPAVVDGANTNDNTAHGTGILVTADGATIKGFEVTANVGDSECNGRGIDVQGSGVTVDSNYVHDVVTSDRPIGIFVWGDENTVDDTSVINNKVETVEATQLGGDCQDESKSRGIVLDSDGDNTDSITSDNVEITDNTIKDIGDDTNSNMANGIEINGGTAQNFKVTSNLITNVDHNQADGYTPTAGGFYITGYKGTDSGYGTNHEISNNHFLLSGTAATADIKLWDADNERENGDQLNVKNNYWGDDGVDYEVQDDMYSGGNLGDDSGAVEYRPFYATSDMSEDVEVVDDPDDTRAFSGTLQAAVDVASSGDTVEASSGYYSETVRLDGSTADNLVIRGATGTRTDVTVDGGLNIKGQTNNLSVEDLTLEGAAASGRTVNLVSSASDLEFKNTVFDGKNTQSSAIYHNNEEVTGLLNITETEIKNYGDGSSGDWGTVYFTPGETEFETVHLINNNIHDNDGSVALSADNDDSSSSDKILVEDNEFVNNLDPSDNGWAALEARDADSAEIRDNTFKGTNQNDQSFRARALQLKGLGSTTFEENTFEDNVVQVKDSAGVLDFSSVVGENTFDQAVKVNTGSSYKDTIWSSIQDAVDSTTSGDTVEVEAGTYDEEITIDVDNLELVGDGTNTVIDASSDAVDISADGVNLKDLKVKGAGTARSDPNGVYFGASSVSDFRMEGVTLTEFQNAIRVSQSTTIDGFEAVDSTIQESNDGIYVAGDDVDGSNGEFNDVLFKNTEFVDSERKGLYIEKLSNATLTGVTVDGITSSSYGFNNGIDINLKGGNYSNITIEDSVVKNVQEGSPYNSNPSFSVAIAIKGRDDSSYTENPGYLHELTLDNVTVENSFNGIRLGEPGKKLSTPQDVVVSNLEFGDNQRYHFTDITENPITAQNMVQNSSFGRATWIEGDSTVWSSIQDGVDSAQTGDTVKVESGTYEEDVKLGPNDLTLKGSGQDNTHIVGQGTKSGTIFVSNDHPGIEVRNLKIESGQNSNAVHVSTSNQITDLTFSQNKLVGDSGEVTAFIGGDHEDIDFNKNTFTSSGSNKVGKHLYLGGQSSYGESSKSATSIDNSDNITGNEFNSYSTSAIEFEGQNGEIRNNTFSTSDDSAEAVSIPGAVADGNSPNIDGQKVKVSENEFPENAKGLVFDGSGTINAENNYWGHPSGPERQVESGEAVGQGSEIEGDVDFKPWLPVQVDEDSSLEISPSDSSITRKNTVDFKAHVIDGESEYEVTGDVDWSASGVDTDVDGNSFTPQSVGTVTVSADYIGNELNLTDETSETSLSSEGDTTTISPSPSPAPSPEDEPEENQTQQEVNQTEEGEETGEQQEDEEETGQEDTEESGSDNTGSSDSTGADTETDSEEETGEQQEEEETGGGLITGRFAESAFNPVNILQSIGNLFSGLF